MTRLSLIGVALLSLAFAPAPLPRRSPSRGDDFGRIRGSWGLHEPGRGGNKEVTRWVFGAGKLEIRAGGNSYFWQYKIDPTASPRALDMRYSPSGNDADVSELFALYSLEGDMLVVGYHSGKWGERPK